MKIQRCHFVITGASRGIGLAVAEMAAASGAHLHLVSRTIGHESKSSLMKLGAASVKFWQVDLSSRADTDLFAKELNKMEVDILFNNAGLLTGGLIEEQNLDEIYSMFQVNVTSLVQLTRAVIPGMMKRKRGKIINNSSVSAFMHFPCASTYAASKAAVVAFTDCIEAELRGTGVNTLCLITPGIKTKMFDDIAVKYSKNLEVPKDHISPQDYANKIKSAIEADAKYLCPGGATSIGLFVAKYLNPIFRYALLKKFKR